eukprot:CAMPEP_0194256514 /NCGR_PEP_ID=MMETSP0158-20130606/36862_1 /TAXON_ID=33649 /ORGANISM="Thalassionema nitzschioides, Strain L26-B" /LENGTH=590 /DNA_ID=CAMNT_0038995223 /DNA_START=63 /DNA_END=1835 /DNA_ORIENTATION=+
MQDPPSQGKRRKNRYNVIQVLITLMVLVGVCLQYASHKVLSASSASSDNSLNGKELTSHRRSDWKVIHRIKNIPQNTSSFLVEREAIFSRPSPRKVAEHTIDRGKKGSRKTFPNLSCGDPWSTAQFSLTGINEQVSYENPIIWSVSGGSEYMLYLKLILKQWFSIGLSPVFIVALDLETATYLCGLGYQSVVWDLPKASYSKVADAKFEVAATFSEMGAPAFFMEVDVFCKKNPMPLFLHSTNTTDDEEYGIVVSGHGYADFVPNIGQYYVRPSENTTQFFRAVAKVLEYSKEHGEYLTHNNVTKSFFDQRLFYQCLPPTFGGDKDYNASQAIYLINDKLRQNNLLSLCRKITHSHLFPWRPVSNVHISANHPPILFDSTVCIHPLFESPLGSLKLKVATARFLGFDPTPVLPESRFLKTLNGDLTFNECWNMPFIGDDMFGHDVFTHKRFKVAISTLIYFAKTSGRILVLPRYFRDSNTHAVMVMALVDIRTIEEIVPVHHLPADSPHTVVLADGNRNNFIADLQKVEDHHVVAVESFCRFFDKKYEKDIREIWLRLRFCLKDPRLRFTKGSGSWNRLCGTDGIYDQDV